MKNAKLNAQIEPFARLYSLGTIPTEKRDEAVAVSKRRAGNSGNAGLFEQRKGVFARFELAPIIDASTFVPPHFVKDVIVCVQLRQLSDEPFSPQRVELAQLGDQLRSLLNQLEVRHEAQLPLARQPRRNVVPGKRHLVRHLASAESHPAESITRQREGFRQAADKDRLLDDVGVFECLHPRLVHLGVRRSDVGQVCQDDQFRPLGVDHVE